MVLWVDWIKKLQSNGQVSETQATELQWLLTECQQQGGSFAAFLWTPILFPAEPLHTAVRSQSVRSTVRNSAQS